MALDHLSDEQFLELWRKHSGNTCHVGAAVGFHQATLDSEITRRKLRDQIRQIRADAKHAARVEASEQHDPLGDQVKQLLVRKRVYRVDGLADQLDVSPKRIRETVERLRRDGFRIPEERAGEITLEKVPPSAVGPAHKALLEGDEVQIAFVSDTHLNSRECAIEHLHLAYQDLANRGFTEVYHPGDLVAGRGIYPTQDQDLLNHTFESQVEYAVENYPRIEGLRTVIIAGNHDIEGAFGRMGADPVRAVANRRDDFTYIGAYEGHVELPNGAFFTMVHGRGGGSYAVSYKPQRWLEGLSPGRKPALVAFGHWHVVNWGIHRNTHFLLAGCFEWRTSLLKRLGLQPVVGYWTVRLRLGDDGTVVRVTKEFTQFQPGRVVR